ncbi:MAG: rRNA maturation RNase YbeY [Eubacteriales bacterium]
MKTRIYLTNDQDKVQLDPKDRNLIKSAIRNALKFEKFERNCEVSVTIVDNDAIRTLNREQRQIDRVTDVLSFPMFDEDFDDGEYAILGDIVLSAERAKEQAEEYGHSFQRELAFLTVHSVLHLLGYDHELGKAEESEMFQKQEQILNGMGLTRELSQTTTTERNKE